MVRARPLPTAAAAVALLVAVLVVAGVVYDHSRAHSIATGIRVGGVPVGGMDEAQARAKLSRQIEAARSTPVRVVLAGHTFTLSPAHAGLRTSDPAQLAARALAVSRQGSIFSRLPRELTGGSVHANVPIDLRYSRAAVDRFTRRIVSEIDRPARDAAVVPSAGGLQETSSQTGRSVDAGVLGARVRAALGGLGDDRTVTAPMTVTHPKVTRGELAARYPAYIIVDRSAFTLRFYRHLKLEADYPIAVGMQGLETPAGLYHIQWKQTNPSWYVPNSAWAGKLAGKVIPPGPQDPIKARWMAFDGGAGIHGIDPSEYWSIGHTASHGCVRMRIPDVIAIYSQTPVGTPVYVA